MKKTKKKILNFFRGEPIFFSHLKWGCVEKSCKSDARQVSIIMIVAAFYAHLKLTQITHAYLYERLVFIFLSSHEICSDNIESPKNLVSIALLR